MELGALVCTPRQPKCVVCPIRTRCVARRTGKVECLPKLIDRTPAKTRRFAAFVVEKRGRFFVRQRPADAVNAHFWEFPNMELAGVDMSLQQAARIALGRTPRELRLLGIVKHTITHSRITLEAYAIQLNGSTAKTGRRGKWLTLEELRLLPVANAHRQILSRLESADFGGIEGFTFAWPSPGPGIFGRGRSPDRGAASPGTAQWPDRTCAI